MPFYFRKYRIVAICFCTGHKRAMELREYLIGQRFLLTSPHDPEDVAQRIREGTLPLFGFRRSGVAGWCRFGLLSLSWSEPFFDNSFQAVFSGRVTKELGSTRVSARYGASLYLRLFLLFWYTFLSLFVIAIGGQIAAAGLQTGFEPLGLAMALLFMGIPFIFYFFAKKSAEQQLERILEFLDETASLRLADAS